MGEIKMENYNIILAGLIVIMNIIVVLQVVGNVNSVLPKRDCV